MASERLVLSMKSDVMRKIERFSEELGITKQAFVMFCVTQTMKLSEEAAEQLLIDKFPK